MQNTLPPQSTPVHQPAPVAFPVASGRVADLEAGKGEGQGRQMEMDAPGQAAEAGTSRIKERISASWSGVSVVPCARWAWVATWRRSS